MASRRRCIRQFPIPRPELMADASGCGWCAGSCTEGLTCPRLMRTARPIGWRDRRRMPVCHHKPDSATCGRCPGWRLSRSRKSAAQPRARIPFVSSCASSAASGPIAHHAIRDIAQQLVAAPARPPKTGGLALDHARERLSELKPCVSIDGDRHATLQLPPLENQRVYFVAQLGGRLGNYDAVLHRSLLSPRFGT